MYLKKKTKNKRLKIKKRKKKKKNIKLSILKMNSITSPYFLQKVKMIQPLLIMKKHQMPSLLIKYIL